MMSLLEDAYSLYRLFSRGKQAPPTSSGAAEPRPPDSAAGTSSGPQDGGAPSNQQDQAVDNTQQQGAPVAPGGNAASVSPAGLAGPQGVPLSTEGGQQQQQDQQQPPGSRLHTTPSGRQLWRVPTAEAAALSRTAATTAPHQQQQQQQQQYHQPSPPASPAQPPPMASAAAAVPAPVGDDQRHAKPRHHDQPHPNRPSTDTALPTPFSAPASAGASPPAPPSTRPPPSSAAAATAGGIAQSRASSAAGAPYASGALFGSFGAAGGAGGGAKPDLDLDVAVVGAGVTGLATALALKRVNPRLRVKVFDRRPPPAGTRRPKYGSYCRLEPNGMRAAAAIHPQLHRALLRNGLRARPVLIHDTDGSLITRLEEGGTRALQRFGEPYITIGWYELEQVLLSLLPPGTVQYGAQYMGHRERDDATYIAFRRSAPTLSYATANGSPTANAAAAAASPHGTTAAPAFPAAVRSQFLVACDGPFSDVRRRVVRDGDPVYDGVVKWLGRLPGDDVPSLPLDFNAVWLSPGRTFLSHSLAGGDVAWEAVVTDGDLRTLGFRYNTTTRRVEAAPAPSRTPSCFSHSASVRPLPDVSIDTRLGTRGSAAAGPATLPRRPPAQGEDTARRLFLGGHGAAAEEPAGESAMGYRPQQQQHDLAELDKGGLDAAAEVSYLGSEDLASEGEEEGGGSEGEEAGDEDARGTGDVLQKLYVLFAGFPPEVRAMLRSTRPSAVVEAGVWVRRAKDLPSGLGRGRVVILGEAAHPMRPSSQEENQALEDAAVLGWHVQRYGLNKEALRRYEADRKPRWRHVMQLAMAANSTPSATSSGLSQALIDYNSALHGAAFHALKPPLGWRLAGAVRRTAKMALWAGSATGLMIAAGSLLDRTTAEQLGPLGPLVAAAKHLQGRVGAATAAAGRAARRTGSIAAGVAAAKETAASTEHGEAVVAVAEPVRRRGWGRLAFWRRGEGRAARAAREAAEAAAEAERRAEEEAATAAAAEAEMRERRRPWWRVDRLVRRVKVPAAQAAAVVVAPAVMAAGSVGEVAAKAGASVGEVAHRAADTVTHGVATTASAALGAAEKAAERTIQKRVAGALGAF